MRRQSRPKMTLKLRTITVILALLTGIVPVTRAATALKSGDTAVVPLQAEVSPSLATFLRRAVKTAETGQAAAIVFEMNTYGGRLDSAEEITTILNHANLPTYTFINTNAGSAGALVALATQHIYMAP